MQIHFFFFLATLFFAGFEVFFTATFFTGLAGFAAFLPFEGFEATLFTFSFLLFSSTAFTTFTNLSTVQATMTDVTVSPGFTSTMASPFVAARLRTPAASSLADLGAPLLVWI